MRENLYFYNAQNDLFIVLQPNQEVDTSIRFPKISSFLF